MFNRGRPSLTTLRLAKGFLAEPNFVATPLYATQAGETWREAFPARHIGPDRAVRYGSTPDFLSKLDHIVPSAGVIESRTLYVVGNHGLVCTGDGTILEDHSWFRGHVDQMKVPTHGHEVQRLPGHAVTLASDWACNGYGHFIQDVLPRLAILERLEIDLSRFDHVICGVPNAFCLSLLERLGVDPRRIVQPQLQVAFKPDVLVAPTLPGARRSMQPWSVDFFRRHLPQEPRQTRRLYIMRSSRKPTNDAALMDSLRPYGFEAYNPGSDMENQARTFAEAEAVIGAEGSAMANLMFCRPGTHVLELLATDHIYPYYFTISMAGSLNYACMVGQSTRTSPVNRFGPSPYDFQIDEAVFAQAVADMAAQLVK